MSIYRCILGKDFGRLHPRLQARYAISIDEPFYAEGTMSVIRTGPKWLKPFLTLAARWKFLFPEQGEDVPFSIRNTCRPLPQGAQEIYWERSFFFPHVTRHFNAFMTLDHKRGIVKDYLGEPSFFYSDLLFAVTEDGRLQICSGSQRFVAGRWEVPIPRLLMGAVTVEEGYDDERQVYTIKVDIQNPIAGRLMAYEGEFKAKSI
ncbi:DUF4166 domain-containing protein [Peribacillus sp. SCS-37]|uniref:DUF4166 domain-containing protein n=1 Tax=Paraperibacillus esterisolvens TaxID=3115296 RepID=UPI003906D2B1